MPSLQPEEAIQSQYGKKETKSGGLGNAAAAPYMKTSVKNYVKYLDTQLNKHADKINIVYNKEANLENVRKFNPDRIIIATGATPVIPPLSGLKDNPKVATAIDYLQGRFHAEGKIVVIGAGLVGCETALDLAHKGCSLTVVEMLDKIVAKDDINANNEMKLNQLLVDAKVDMKFQTKVKSVEGNKVVLEKDGKETSMEFDYILVAAGMRSNDTLVDQLSDEFDDVYVIGDANTPGKIMEAVHQGYAIANNIL